MLYLSFLLLGLAALSGVLGFLLLVGLSAAGAAKLLFGLILGVLAVSMAWHLLRNV